ncbi:12783_t:CDS:2, partial [Dentiscutata heterogama]
EYNDNSPVECNDNSAEEYVKNFTESVVDQNFYAESTQEKTHLNQYARSARFCIYRKRVECSFSRESIPNQVIDSTQQRQWPSRKIRCSWHINLTMPKAFSEVGITNDETTESYEWFLNCVLEVTNNVSPTCLFSDSEPALINTIVLKMLTTHHFLCIFHIQENLPKDYLNHTLKHCYKAWAKCYQVKYFIAGIQSMQRVEMMNRIIKNGVSSSSSLSPSIIESVFLEVIELLKEYLTPYILSVQRQQILGFLLYHAMLIPRETIHAIQETIGITTLFQNANTNHVVVPDLYILDKFRAPHTFIAKIRQHAQKKVKYVSGSEKAKRVLNLALDM